MNLIDDTIDFSAYGRVDASAKVRAASSFLDLLETAFTPCRAENRAPAMLLPKLKAIEFRPGETTVWAGFNGHRKSILTSQLLLDLCVQRQACLAMSFEMLPAQTLARMARQAAGFAHPTPEFLRRFAKWTDHRLWIFDHFGRFSPDQTIAVLNYFAQEHRGRHVVIDSMMMVCASEEHLDEQKQFMTDAVQTAQETGLHIHLVAHMRKPSSGDESKCPTKYDIRGSGAISDQASNIVCVWANKAKKEALDKGSIDTKFREQPDAVVRIEKQRNGAFEGGVNLYFDDSSLRFVEDAISAVEPYAFTVRQVPEEMAA